MMYRNIIKQLFVVKDKRCLGQRIAIGLERQERSVTQKNGLYA
jgi:hypothetical protein